MKQEYVLPKGFKSCGIQGGVKKDKMDTGFILSEKECDAVGFFTMNKLKSAHIQYDMKVIGNKIRAVFANSGNANAFTGSRGLSDLGMLSAGISKLFDIDRNSILFASTGIIGKPLPVDNMLAKIPALKFSVVPDDVNFPKAIMTTDLKEKYSSAEIVLAGGKARVTAVGKGSGMISPNVATMLVFVMTDAAVSKKLLHKAAKEAVGMSFNRITVDGDMSPNDTVLCLSNGMADNKKIIGEGKDFEKLKKAIKETFYSLAEQMVKDGEGATKFIKISVKGAVSDKDARTAALGVANSQLVKTAFFGCSLNMGRIVSALGASGAQVVPEKVHAVINGLTALKAGVLSAGEELAAELKKRDLNLDIDLKQGNGVFYVLTCDLSYDYVKINADYT
jgi:glutamate N-acetyltransferase/amino-acid N-acetyltransferase